ncbi:DUF4202 domain-containing protein [Pseudochryseolinea flava]|uniref:DUF4202 domain-containing protein n=1 Tax=Pseudochryseolinea flava TaxID=2059302 RepID=A0A364XZW2_9BACT|nr:DUF4202 domain-containing protein [Pseudochryseolinea flava]RAW00064.1 DUF4202 domain-containing protein [Pseudochryseolinea flava]
MSANEKLERAFATFDAYNANDTHQEVFEGKSHPKELLYGIRMTERLNRYAPNAPEYLQLAARAQHVGRWEIPRESYSMDKKGYLQWRNAEKFHHAEIAQQVLSSCRYDQDIIDKVKFLLLKKELKSNTDTQTLEDVVCLVFIEYYLEEFAAKHDDDKVVDILQKTLKKMTPRAIQEAVKIPVSDRIGALIARAAA